MGVGRAASEMVTGDRAEGHSAPSHVSPGREFGAKPLIIDLDGIDLSSRKISRKEIELQNPHRGQMALLDWIVWHSPDYKLGIGLKHVRHDEFWVPGHFPGKPMMPGVLQIETGAQVASFLYNVRFPVPKIAAFIHLTDASFRAAVEPGDDLYVLCRETKFGPRRFGTKMQGLVNGKVAFEATITGMAL